MNKWSRLRFSPCLPMGKDGRRITGSDEQIRLSREAAAEGMVLLKNENSLLPLRDGERIAVFGKAQYDYVKGGGGSGDVTVDHITNIYDGLKIKESEGKICVYDGLIDFYKNETEKQYSCDIHAGMTSEPELPQELLDKAAAFTDTAIITICRYSGEAWDRKGEPQDGDFYLSANEEKMISSVLERFKNIIVVINAGAQTDSEWYHSNDKISSVLYAWQGGMEGGLAIADIICGDVTPSGKLVDTFAKRFSDYPSSDSFEESEDYVKYYEDIYVGYRYFETIPGADKKVNYPFGFGLSYTDFEISDIDLRCNENKISVSASVTNTGKEYGKEVVQVYYSAPQPLTANAPDSPAMLIDVCEGKVSLDSFIKQLTDDELIGLAYGQPNKGVADTYGMGNLEKYGIPNVMTADGPAGIRILPDRCVTTTAFPCATLLACSWDPELIYEIGKAGAREAKENNIGIWLTPAMNIHRNPLCGRNFEYFSEDPLLTGKMAAAKVRGIQSQHIAASAKHLCANNKEVNRMESDSIVSERALREIYLKGFEICVKESQPWTVMSSYNLINGTRASENYDIITNILRNEWGFKGMVTTDWYNHADERKELLAGNDIKMPYGYHEQIKDSLDAGSITRDDIEVCVKRILEMIMKLD